MGERRLLLIASQCAKQPQLSFLPDYAQELYRVLTDPELGRCVPALPEDEGGGLLLDPTVKQTKKKIREAYRRASDDQATLFLAYVQAANRLVGQPEFYNTLTSNCTTLVYRMARQIDPGLPWDARLLLTGYLPGYLHDVGAVDRSVPLDELRRRGRITGRARNAARDDFSLAIRTNEP